MNKLIAFILLIYSVTSSAAGDTLKEACYHSMKYTVAVQMSANAASTETRTTNSGIALDEGKWLGLHADSVKRDIFSFSKSDSSKEFAHKYELSDSFASSFRNTFISECQKNPSQYVIR